MSQHDQNIANDTGAAVRGDINAALAAIFGNSSGASAPGTTIAYQWWADTTANLLKQRNAANTGWLVRGTLAETFGLSRASNTILGVGDVGRMIIATSTFTQTFTAAATLGDGWWVLYRNDGTGVITLDPNASETIDGATTITLQPGEACLIFCNGTLFKTFGRRRINDLTEDTAPDATADFVETWDASAGAHKKVKFQNFPAGGLTKLDSGTVSNAATVDIDLEAHAAYRHLKIVFSFLPATDAVFLDARASTDGGGTFLSGANYNYTVQTVYDDGTEAKESANAGVAIGLSEGDIGNASNEGIRGYVDIYDHASTSLWALMSAKCVYQNSGAAIRVAQSDTGAAVRIADDITDWRFFFSSGNIASGEWTLYGFR